MADTLLVYLTSCLLKLNLNCDLYDMQTIFPFQCNQVDVINFPSCANVHSRLQLWSYKGIISLISQIGQQNHAVTSNRQQKLLLNEKETALNIECNKAKGGNARSVLPDSDQSLVVSKKSLMLNDCFVSVVQGWANLLWDRQRCWKACKACEVRKHATKPQEDDVHPTQQIKTNPVRAEQRQNNTSMKK